MQRINDGIKVVLDINEEITYDRRALFSENDSIRTLLKKTNRGFQFPALIDGSKTFNCDLLIFAEPQIEVNEIRVER